MAMLNWADKYNTGNSLIDAQHQKLFALVNAFNDSIKAKGTADIKKTMNELTAYTKEHFAQEESLMAQANYPKIGEHKMIHQELINQIGEIQAKLSSGKPVSLVTVVRFLSDWLISHIMQEDMAYKSYLK